jgi:hypothetical protein
MEDGVEGGIFDNKLHGWRREEGGASLEICSGGKLCQNVIF